jgi:hypothetical protein
MKIKTSLIKELWRKEKVHWLRIVQMFERFNGWLNKCTFGMIVAFFVCLGHYAFVFMSAVSEFFIFIFARETFKENLQKMHKSTIFLDNRKTIRNVKNI